MSLVEYVLIAGVYFVIGFSIHGFESVVLHKNVDDYELALIILWPLALLIGAVFQLIHYIIAAFKGEH